MQRIRIRMKFSGICLVFLTVVLATKTFAGEFKEIELKDGSLIFGEIVSFSGGVYTIKSMSLGTLIVKESKIRNIRFKTSEGSAGVNGISGYFINEAHIQALQQSMMADPEIMKIILSLQNDPVFQEAMKDRSIIEALNTDDVEALLSNPKFMNLLKSPAVQDIGRKVGE
ncbi:MAG: hypothetical protein SV375_21470 [Thermodesulfobacteriota bacterium]|nr:hypothetical protein [Thermodesulfobacteriota bacterium]